MSDTLSDKKRTVKNSSRDRNPRPTRPQPSLAATMKMASCESDQTECQSNSEHADARPLEPRPGMKLVRKRGLMGRFYVQEVPIADADEPTAPVDAAEEEEAEAEAEEEDLSSEDAFRLALCEYEMGFNSVYGMRQNWPDRFTKEVEEAATKRRRANELGHAGDGDCDVDVTVEETGEEVASDSCCNPPRSTSASEEPLPQAGTPSLLRWTKRRGMVAVPADFVRITKNSHQAIVLAQLCYWFDYNAEGEQRANFRRYGRVWEPKTHAQWSTETGLSVAQVKTAITGLFSSGFIARDYASVRGLRTTLLRPLLHLV